MFESLLHPEATSRDLSIIGEIGGMEDVGTLRPVDRGLASEFGKGAMTGIRNLAQGTLATVGEVTGSETIQDAAEDMQTTTQLYRQSLKPAAGGLNKAVNTMGQFVEDVPGLAASFAGGFGGASLAAKLGSGFVKAGELTLAGKRLVGAAQVAGLGTTLALRVFGNRKIELENRGVDSEWATVGAVLSVAAETAVERIGMEGMFGRLGADRVFRRAGLLAAAGSRAGGAGATALSTVARALYNPTSYARYSTRVGVALGAETLEEIVTLFTNAGIDGLLDAEGAGLPTSEEIQEAVYQTLLRTLPIALTGGLLSGGRNDLTAAEIERSVTTPVTDETRAAAYTKAADREGNPEEIALKARQNMAEMDAQMAAFESVMATRFTAADAKSNSRIIRTMAENLAALDERILPQDLLEDVKIAFESGQVDQKRWNEASALPDPEQAHAARVALVREVLGEKYYDITDLAWARQKKADNDRREVELFGNEKPEALAKRIVITTTFEQPTAAQTVNLSAFSNQEEYYRVVRGEAAFRDILDTGTVRTDADRKKASTTAGINLEGRPTAFPSFSKGSVNQAYAEGRDDHYIISTDDPSIMPSTRGRHGRGTTMFPTDAAGNPMAELPAKAVKVYKHVGNGKYKLVYNKGTVTREQAAAAQPTTRVLAQDVVDKETYKRIFARGSVAGVKAGGGTYTVVARGTYLDESGKTRLVRPGDLVFTQEAAAPKGKKKAAAGQVEMPTRLGETMRSVTLDRAAAMDGGEFYDSMKRMIADGVEMADLDDVRAEAMALVYPEQRQAVEAQDAKVLETLAEEDADAVRMELEFRKATGQAQIAKFKARYGEGAAMAEPVAPVVAPGAEGVDRPGQVKSFADMAERLAAEKPGLFGQEILDRQRAAEKATQLELFTKEQIGQLTDFSEGRFSARETTPFAFYDPKTKIAHFFANAKSTDVVHELFHHMTMTGIMPSWHLEALKKNYGLDTPDGDERAVEGFMRYLRTKELPEGSDPKLKDAFDHMRQVFAATMQPLSGQLNNETLAVFDTLFGFEPSGEVAEAAAALQARILHMAEIEGGDSISKRAEAEAVESLPDESGRMSARANFSRTKYASFEDYGEVFDEQASTVLTEIEEGRTEQIWPVLPAARVEKIWGDYARMGFVRDEKGVDSMARMAIEAVARLDVNTQLVGHAPIDPSEVIERAGREDRITPEMLEAAYDTSYFSNRYSDYALEPLQADAMMLMQAETAEEKVQILDRMFNRVHARGDIADLFIEGGVKTLNRLAGVEGSESGRFSARAVTPEQDAAYLAAVESGDTETQQRIVNEAARAAEYTQDVFHGTRSGGFTVFDTRKAGTGIVASNSSGGFYFSSSREGAEYFADQVLVEKEEGIELSDADTSVYGDGPFFVLVADEGGLVNINTGPFATSPEAQDAASRFVERWNDAEVGDEVFRDDKIMHVRLRMDNPLVVDSIAAMRDAEHTAKRQGYDGIIAEDVADGGTVSDVHIVFDPSQIKSADPVTYGPDGKPVKLSERFRTDRQGDESWKNDDIRFSARPLSEAPADDDKAYSKSRKSLIAHHIARMQIPAADAVAHLRALAVQKYPHVAQGDGEKTLRLLSKEEWQEFYKDVRKAQDTERAARLDRRAIAEFGGSMATLSPAERTLVASIDYAKTQSLFKRPSLRNPTKEAIEAVATDLASKMEQEVELKENARMASVPAYHGSEGAGTVQNLLRSFWHSAKKFRRGVFNRVLLQTRDIQSLAVLAADNNPNSVFMQIPVDIRDTDMKLVVQQKRSEGYHKKGMEKAGITAFAKHLARPVVVAGQAMSFEEALGFAVHCRGKIEKNKAGEYLHEPAESLFLSNGRDYIGEQGRDAFDAFILDAWKTVNADKGVRGTMLSMDEYFRLIEPDINASRAKRGQEAMGHGAWYFPRIREGGMFDDGDVFAKDAGITPTQTAAKLPSDSRTRKRTLAYGGRIRMDVLSVFDEYRRQADRYIAKETTMLMWQSALDKSRKAFADKGLTDELEMLYNHLESERHYTGRITPLSADEIVVRGVSAKYKKSIFGLNNPAAMLQPMGALNVNSMLPVMDAWRAPINVISMMGRAFFNLGRKFPNVLKGNEYWDMMVAGNSKHSASEFSQIEAGLQKGKAGYFDFSIKGVPLSDIPFMPLRIGDMIGRAAAWGAAYESQMRQLRNTPSLTKEQKHDKAFKFAEDAVEETQAAGMMSGRTWMQKSNEYLKAIVPFTSQQSKDWNILSTRLLNPMQKAWKAGAARGGTMSALNEVWEVVAGTEHAKREYGIHRGAGQVLAFSYVVPAMMMAALSRGRPPEDFEEFLADLLAYNVAIIPLFGPPIRAAIVMDRFFDQQPIYFKLVNETAKIVKAAKDKDGEEFTWAAVRTAAMASGLPLKAVKVFEKGMKGQFTDQYDELDMKKVMTYSLLGQEALMEVEAEEKEKGE